MKFEIGDLVEHIEHDALGLVVDLDEVGYPIIMIIKSDSGDSALRPFLKEGTKGPFYPYKWKHTEE